MKRNQEDAYFYCIDCELIHQLHDALYEDEPIVTKAMETAKRRSFLEIVERALTPDEHWLPGI